MKNNQQFKRFESPEYFARFKEIFPEMDEMFMFNFARTMQLLHRVIIMTESYFSSVGLSKGRFMILVNLLAGDPVKGESISDLLPFHLISSATMTGLLDTLEKSGMIERLANSADRRKVNIRLTESGRGFIMNFLPQHQQNAKTMSSLLSDKERSMLPDILMKLIDGIQRFLTGNGYDPCAESDKDFK